MSEKTKTSDQCKRVKAHFAEPRPRVQKLKAKPERVNIGNGGRALTADQLTMPHDAYGLCRSLYAHTLSLEKKWPMRVLDGTPFLDAEFLWNQMETACESIGLFPQPVKEGEIPALEIAGENEEDPFLKKLEEERGGPSGITGISTFPTGVAQITTASSHVDALPSTSLRPFASTLAPPIASTGYQPGPSLNIEVPPVNWYENSWPANWPALHQQASEATPRRPPFWMPEPILDLASS